jgi:hypothetical protein
MTEMRRITLLTVAVLFLLPFTAKAELPVKKVLTLEIMFENKVIGAIGVSGNTPQEDEDIAKVGATSAASAIAN